MTSGLGAALGSARRHWVASSAAALVVIGGIGAAVWLAFIREGDALSGPPVDLTAYQPMVPVVPEPEPADDKPANRIPKEHTPAVGRGIGRVEIPSIDVSAPMIRLGLNPDETLEVPARPDDTGWWSGGAFPGERGPAVIAGHIDSQGGPAVFHRLNELSPGDKVVVIDEDGSRASFVVDHAEQHPKDDFPTQDVYGETPDATLRLVTCGGTFDAARGHYDDNYIVYANEA